MSITKLKTIGSWQPPRFDVDLELTSAAGIDECKLQPAVLLAQHLSRD